MHISSSEMMIKIHFATRLASRRKSKFSIISIDWTPAERDLPRFSKHSVSHSRVIKSSQQRDATRVERRAGSENEKCDKALAKYFFNVRLCYLLEWRWRVQLQASKCCSMYAGTQYGAREFFRTRNLFLLVFVSPLSASTSFYLGAFSLMKFMFIY
jgi:hypothetical protein